MNLSSNSVQEKDCDRKSPFHPVVLVLDNLRSAYNVGNIFRLAEVSRIRQIVTCGYTPSPPHAKLKKTARGCEEKVLNSHCDSSLEAVLSFKEEGYQTVGIETVESAKNIWDVNLKFPVVFVFGNEAFGVKKQTLDECDVYAKLPVFGWKNSLNVSNCAAVVVYSAIHQLMCKTLK